MKYLNLLDKIFTDLGNKRSRLYNERIINLDGNSSNQIHYTHCCQNLKKDIDRNLKY